MNATHRIHIDGIPGTQCAAVTDISGRSSSVYGVTLVAENDRAVVVQINRQVSVFAIVERLDHLGAVNCVRLIDYFLPEENRNGR